MEAPRNYRGFLERAGGRNPLEEPNFILHWTGKPLYRRDAPPQEFEPGLECWSLLYWRPPEDFGPKELWPADLGPYPSRGYYLIFLPCKFSGQVAALDSAELNLRVLGVAVRTILKHQDDSLATRDRVIKEHLAKKDERLVSLIEQAVHSASPRFGDSASYLGQKNCNTVVKQKMDSIERTIKTLGIARLQGMARGLSTRRSGAAFEVPLEGQEGIIHA